MPQEHFDRWEPPEQELLRKKDPYIRWIVHQEDRAANARFKERFGEAELIDIGRRTGELAWLNYWWAKS